jgi:hypothetical protein
MSERKTTEELAALLAGCVVAGVPVPRESSTLEARAAFLRWQHDASKHDYSGISGFGVFPFDLPEVGSQLVIDGAPHLILSSRWGRESEGDRVQYNLIVRREEATQEDALMRKFTATVHFTDSDLDPVIVEEDNPDKARIYALQKAKLTGNEPERVEWETPGQPQVMLWPSQEQMSVEAYRERASG